MIAYTVVGRVPGKAKPVRLCRNKSAAEIMLNELVKKAEFGRAGIIDPFELHRKEKAETAMRRESSGMVRNSLRHVTDLSIQALERSQGISAISAAERVYQFKITLKDSHPPIWRRIKLKDCTLNKLHEHIQTAMGWTNSHLNHFKIGDQSLCERWCRVVRMIR